MTDITDGEYLEMANHAKELIDRKEKVIRFLKAKILDIDQNIRKVEYKVKQMEHLITYEKSVSKNKECKQLLTYLEKDLKYIYNVTDTTRINCQEDVEEELILILETDSIDSD